MLTLLAYLTGTASDSSVLSTALRLAKPFGGHVECLRVEPSREALIAQAMRAETDLSIGMTALLGDLVDKFEQLNAERTKLAHEAVLEFCRMEDVAYADLPPGPAKVSVAWHQNTTSDENGHLTRVARFYDLVVLAGGSDRPGRLSSDLLGNIIVGCGRPVVLAPEKERHVRVKRIAIAWKDAPESARALTASMPLLAGADAVDIITVNEDDDKTIECLDCADGLLLQLKWHGIAATRRFVLPAGRTTSAAILETAHSVGADLLVMGGYGHSRLREFVFGGVTKEILKGVGFPVLLFH